MREVTWKELCVEIMHEEDPERLFALAEELNNMLDQDQPRPQHAAPLQERRLFC